MLAFFTSLGTWFKVGAGAVLGALLMWAAMTVYTAAVALPRAREAARAAEQVALAGKLQAARDAAEAAKKAAQARIDAIEQEYWQKDVARAQQLSALDQALEQEKKNAKAGLCSVAVPAGVSGALDAIGRRDSAAGAAKPDAALR